MDSQNAIDFDLDFKYNESNKKALCGIEGHIEKGKCVVLCGGSGCGKSTLLYCLNLLVPQFYDGELKGFCNLNSIDTSKLSIGEVGKMAASVFQDPRSQFFTLTSTTEIAFGLENFGFSHNQIVNKVNEMFDTFNLQRLKGKNVFELSSGERQLVAILSARAVDTDIYLLDEPTANLDYASIEKLKGLLSILKDQNKTMVISEHRLYYLKDIADEYWLIKNGKITRKIDKSEMDKLSIDELCSLGLRTNDLEKVVYQKPNKSEKISTSHCIELKNINFKYKKCAHNILENVNLKANTGEIIGLLGANGCGKTTLGKIITGLYKPTSGEIFFDNEKVNSTQLVRGGIFIMQEAEFQFFTNSVMNELLYGVKGSEEIKKRKAEIEVLLKEVNLWSCRNKHPFSLSGGQMQKLVLLLAYFSEKPCVLLDEPSAGLDYESLDKCSELIRKMSLRKIVFVISHDLELLSKVCTRSIYIENASIKACFDLQQKFEFTLMKEHMVKYLSSEKNIKKEKNIEKESGKKFNIDPRVKIFIFILALISGIGTNVSVICLTYVSILLVFIMEGKIIKFISGLLPMAAIFLSYHLIKNVVTAFIVSFFPRMLVICFAALMLSGKNEATRTLAALRKLHVHEKIIMIFSVIFRFFPVLSKDLKIMRESLKTRGFFPKLKDKIKAIPEYLEIMIVPMVFRVIRIAEALSASAETRGIDLKCKRESYIELKIGFLDIVVLCLAIALFALGFIIL